MNKKDITMIRRHLKAGTANTTHIYGCYANCGEKKIISQYEASVALMSDTELSMYMDIIKKAVSGSNQKNLVSVPLERDGRPKAMLQELWEQRLNDPTMRDELFCKIVESAMFEKMDNMLILLAEDCIDIIRPSEDVYGELESDGTFHYFVCAICPVKDADAELAYIADNKAFHTNTVGQTAQSPVIGFMYPAIDNGSGNLDKALYYMKKPTDPHDEIVNAMFGVERPNTDVERQDTFRESLIGASGGACDFIVAQNMFQRLRDKTEEIKQNIDNAAMIAPRPEDVRDMLKECGYDDELADEFYESYAPAVGRDIRLMPNAIMDSDKVVMTNDAVKITAAPELIGRIHIRNVDGVKYVMIPFDEGISLNGLDVS